MRTIEMSAKTIDDAVQSACEALGVDRDDVNVSYEVLEFPARKLFKTIPAKVRVTVTEEEVAAPAAEPVAEPAAQPAPAAAQETPAQTPKANTPDPDANKELVLLDIEADPRLQAAVDYLTPIFKLMGVEEFSFTAFQKGEATIIKVTGEHMGALIGRRGETMENLSYLASLVVNRMEGPYVKLGLDVGGYRDKREEDLSSLAGRIAQRVVRTGCYYEMEAMNPYERHIIHAAIASIDGVRSESKGEGPYRHVVIYSTDPSASNLPDRESQRNNRNPRREGGRGRRDGSRPYQGNRGPRREGGPRSDNRGPRGPRPYSRDGERSYAPKSNVPPREFADAPRDETAQPVAPSRSERIHDGEDFEFGKISF